MRCWCVAAGWIVYFFLRSVSGWRSASRANLHGFPRPNNPSQYNKIILENDAASSSCLVFPHPRGGEGASLSNAGLGNYYDPVPTTVQVQVSSSFISQAMNDFTVTLTASSAILWSPKCLECSREKRVGNFKSSALSGKVRMNRKMLSALYWTPLRASVTCLNFCSSKCLPNFILQYIPLFPSKCLLPLTFRLAPRVLASVRC